MKWLSMYPANEHTNALNKMAYVIVTLTIFSINFTGFLSNFAYFYKYLSIDIEGSLLALMVCNILGGLAYSFATAIIMRYEIQSIYDKLSSIYGASKYCTVILI